MHPHRTTVTLTCIRCGAARSVSPQQVKRGQRFCSVRCAARERWASPAERFWSYVQKTDTCWLWTAGCDSRGYGVFWIDGRTESAHRFSWQFHYGPIPEGLSVLHHCDTPPCIRPDHLFLGTRADNVADMVRKGRQARGERSSSYLYPRRGELNGRAKLTDAHVRAIRVMYAEGGITTTALGERFGVSDVMIGKIIARKAWAHVA